MWSAKSRLLLCSTIEIAWIDLTCEPPFTYESVRLRNNHFKVKTSGKLSILVEDFLIIKNPQINKEKLNYRSKATRWVGPGISQILLEIILRLFHMYNTTLANLG